MLGICVIFPPVPYTQNLFKLSSGPEPSQMIFYVIIFFFLFTYFYSKDVSSDFVCSVEVYSHMLRDDMSIASTRRKIKNTIHSSISRTVGKKLAATLRDELNSGQM